MENIYQAEDALFSGPVLSTGQGAQGTGFLDYKNATGDFVEWTINVPTDGIYDLSWRYANGQSNRPQKLDINGNTQVTNLNFAGTGSWETWKLLTKSVNLKAGENKIRLTATGSSGANFDYLKVSESQSSVSDFGSDQVHLAWVDDPATTLTVVWRTFNTDTPSKVEYRAIGQTNWQVAEGSLRPSGTTGTLHEVTLKSLNPNTDYEYRVQGDNSTWSEIYATQTAPSLGPADFTAIYVADTGLVGRKDGLTTGTQQVIDEIDALDPLLILGGGDYAYFNTDNRFPTLDDAIDEWFNQWEPVLSASPIMTTYGNHEIRLGEGYEPWADRFPTPEGLDNRRNYSFDIGDVHFVSILSQEEQRGLTNAQLDWIEQDIVTAQQKGQRWIVPYFHAGPFGEGLNHPSNRGVRNQLVPLFEELDVDLVIYSHDQSYERTYPLVDTYTTTSSSLTDYTKQDGVVYVKTSPGGKLSNKNGGFAQFPSETMPSYMAFRDNTMHHFSQLSVFDEGFIRLDTYGLLGDGSPPVIVDSFQIFDDSEFLVVDISDASAIEGADDFLVFNVSLSSTSTENITLALAASDISAKGGLIANFGNDPAGNSVDYSNQFEVSNNGVTWQQATNGTEVTFAAGQTNLMVRLAVNDDTTDEGLNNETMNLKVANVLSGTVDSAADTGTGSIVDNDGDIGLDVIYQAEDALLSGPVVIGGNGAEGTGYVDYQNALDDYIEWTVDIPTASTYELSWRYANGHTNRPLSLAVNDTNINSSLDFAGTGSWATWGFVNQEIALQEGRNTIRLTANGSSGANFDYLRITEKATTVPINVSISDAVATEGTDDFLVFDVSLSSASNEKITLDLAATDIAAKGGLIANFGNDSAGDPVDYSNQKFEVSIDGGLRWQQATNGTEVTFIPGQTDIKVRLAVNDDASAEGSSAETLSLGVAQVLSGTVADTSDTGTGSLVDNDNNGNSANIYQAEDALFSGPAFFAGRGAQGTGFLDYQNATGDFVEWTVNVATAGTYDLSWRYANGQSNRPLELDVNGNPQVTNLDFAGTGSWETWDFVSKSVNLKAGENKIRLTATGSSGANFDYLEVMEPGSNDDNGNVANIYQAEDALFSGPAFFAGRGAQGTGFLDYQNATGDFVEWTVNVATAGTYDLSWRYANGQSNRPLELDVNGNPQVTNLDFAGTGSWETWDFVSKSVNLKAGENKIRLTATGSSGANFDYLKVSESLDSVDNGNSSESSISTLPLSEVRVEGDLVFDFEGTDSGMVDKDGDSLGFTMVDPTSNPGNPNSQNSVVGYLPENLDVDPTNGVLKLTTTSGLSYVGSNSLDNALGVGLNLPSKSIGLETTLIDLPSAPGGSAQAGLWFGKAEGGGTGTSEDDYIKVVIRSDKTGNYLVEALMEQDGVVIASTKQDIPDNLESLTLNLVANPESETVTAQYKIGGGAAQTLTTFSQVPEEWFSFDQAGINPNVGTRSFGGIFASHRNAASPQVFTFENFVIDEEEALPKPPTPVSGDLPFDRWSIPVNNPTAMALGPDGRLYVATLFGKIHALTIDPDTRAFTDEVINTIPNKDGNRLTLGIAVDPDSTADDVTLWVSHSDGSVSNGALNSGTITRLSGPNFTQKEDIITGLPRAIANHANNNIDFGPDGRLYIWHGGNTGAGSANNADTEFKDRPEQVLSAAVLVADIPKWKADPASFHGDVASPIGEFKDEFYARKEQELGRPFTEVQVYASGLRNTYDGVFHSNGSLYATDNGLGVTGTAPPVPRLGDPTDRDDTTLFGDVSQDNPGKQPDLLNRIVEGEYYGHPNPYRDEVVFKDGSFQGFDNTDNVLSNDLPSSHPEYKEPFFNLGFNRSANGIIEYTADNFFGQLQGDLLITNYSKGDNLTRIKLSSDGLSVVDSSSLISDFTDPLPIAMGPDGSIFVGEFNGGKVTVLEPLGTWRTDLPKVPKALLDPGSATLDGKLYLVGGKTASTHLSSLYIYDPNDPIDSGDDEWSVGPNLLGPGVENPAVTASDGKLYTFGGSTAPFSGAVSNAAVFDPTSSTWTSLAAMPTARGGATAQILNDKIYVIGGMGTNGASLDTVEVYDPSTNQWSTGVSMQTPRDNLGAAVVDDLLYVFGGRTRNADGSVVNDTLDSLEIFDPLTGEWEFGKSMPTGRRAFSVGTLNGRIQAIGGEKAPGGAAFNQHEEYNPLTDSWRTLPSIVTPRHGAAVGTIDDVIYIAGGGPTAGSAFTDAVEAFTV